METAHSQLRSCSLSAKSYLAVRTQTRLPALHKRYRKQNAFVSCSLDASSNDGTVLVLGASGGVGQLVVPKLSKQGYNVRAAGRSKERMQQFYQKSPDIELAEVDSRDRNSAFDDRLWKKSDSLPEVSTVICTTGTTAFPSNRWEGGTPDEVDNKGVRCIVDAAVANDVKRFILISSQGVERTKEIPFVFLNMFGVLDAKKKGETAVIESGIPFTIFRPGRLTDGPYTSYDINTILQATAGNRQNVQIGMGDVFLGEMSRVALADAIVMSLKCDEAVNKTFSIISVEGPGSRPDNDPAEWNKLFGRSI